MRNTTRFGISLIICSVFINVISCNKASENTTPPKNYELATSSLARDTNPTVADADVAAVVAGNTDFALKLFPLLDPSGGLNTVFSPYSITQAVALAAAGAKDATLSGIEHALSFPLPQASQNPALNRLDLLLASKTTGTIYYGGFQAPSLNLVNSIWGQKDYTILPEYLDTIALNFGAGLYRVDFIKATEDARVAINTWVEDQTNNRIKDLIPQGGVSDMTRVVLTNAIWFKANWANPFEAAKTADQTFNNRNNSQSSVPFMKQTLTAPYSQSNGCQANDLPYVEGKLSLLVIMPGTFDTFMSALTPTILDNIINSLSYQSVALALPKFTFSMGPDLGEILPLLGMTDAFNPSEAVNN